jgi:hypothetical protein
MCPLLKVLNIKTTLKNYINNKIPLKFKELWRNSLFDDNRRASCNNKLRTYRLFKDKFIKENYLKWGKFLSKTSSPITAKLVERLLTSNAYLQIFICTFSETKLLQIFIKVAVF